MAHDRPQRVGHLIQQELGRLFAKGFRDPRISRIVTITGVKVPPDLKQAIVYYSVLGTEEERRETAQGLAAARGYMRREIGHVIGLRYTPELRFVFDEAIERGDRIDRLLKEVSSEARPDRADDAADDGADDP
ncbi:MAG TPA: 30S ribosome-binding factor RbfA [Vulgatibacter sp.]|nr:30S ribosome-binding factor RbfA [Vulgatibacter sp.]